jgi:hypothetical protein
MAHAMERLFATPTIRPCFPVNSIHVVYRGRSRTLALRHV